MWELIEIIWSSIITIFLLVIVVLTVYDKLDFEFAILWLLFFIFQYVVRIFIKVKVDGV